MRRSTETNADNKCLKRTIEHTGRWASKVELLRTLFMYGYDRGSKTRAEPPLLQQELKES